MLLGGGVVASVVPSLISQVTNSHRVPETSQEFQVSVSSIVKTGDPPKPPNTSTNAPANPGLVRDAREWMKNVGVTNEKVREFMVDAWQNIGLGAGAVKESHVVVWLPGWLALVPV
ncbi:MAG: hypothetical protein Ct9H300mP32_5860 [Verrucomicrobiota bacterium]|nr:MAG: hypothetical protein Ct9H300mP32_5860 [Verrucomicrobiota bacterium]